jgi:hypothetical protein
VPPSRAATVVIKTVAKAPSAMSGRSARGISERSSLFT